MSSPDHTLVELPLIEQLQQMGWDYLEGAPVFPTSPSGRTFARCCSPAGCGWSETRRARRDETHESGTNRVRKTRQRS
jgi:hypothetical protein